MYNKTLSYYYTKLAAIDRLQMVITTLLFIVIWVSFLICIGPMLSIIATLTAAAVIVNEIPRNHKEAKNE